MLHPDVVLGALPGYGSNAHNSRPVSASRAAARLYAVLRYRTLSIMIGVASKAPGLEPNSAFGISPGLHVHACSSWWTFAGVMSGRVE